jgi:hypothetical protein
MKSKKKILPEIKDENLSNSTQDPDDSLKPIQEDIGELPEISMISKRSKTINRKIFIKSAASIAGLAALGNFLKSCVESELEIIPEDDNCGCHAVCTCDSVNPDA